MRTALIVALYFLTALPIFSQKGVVSLGNLPFPEAVKIIAQYVDSMVINSKYHVELYTQIDDSLTIHNRDTDMVVFRFPMMKNEASAGKAFSVLDSLARSDNYNLKIVSNRIFSTLTRYLIEQISIVGIGENKRKLRDWELTLLENMVNSDMENNYRIIGDGAVLYLPASLYSQSNIQNVEIFFNNPYLSESEASIIAQRGGPTYLISDTTGFSELNKDFRNLTQADKHRVRVIRDRIFWAKELEISLSEYYNKRNREEYEKSVRAFLGQQTRGVSVLINQLGKNNVYVLSPTIERVFKSDDFMLQDGAVDFKLILARLNYKEYPESQIEFYSNLLNGVVEDLKVQELGRPEVNKIDWLLISYRGKLEYINSQKSFQMLAPLILIETYTYQQEDRYSLGAHYFLELNEKIKNFPWDKKALEEVGPNEVPFVVNAWYIDNKMPNDFLKKMYDWMISNKGKYQLK